MGSSHQKASKLKKYIHDLVIEADVAYTKFEKINTDNNEKAYFYKSKPYLDYKYP